MAFANSTNLAGQVVYPLLRAVSNGVSIPGLEKVDCRENSFFHASTFNATFALTADDNFYIGFWADVDRDYIPLDLQIGLTDASGQVTWQSIIQGRTDHAQITLGTGTVSVSGRDYSSNFIDAKTSAAYPNMTSSQIAQTLAESHGMQFDIDDTGTLAGRYYADDHDAVRNGAFSRGSTEWDLLASLAQKESFDLFVRGTTLYFKQHIDRDPNPWKIDAPRVTRTGPSSVIWTGGSNIGNMQLERAFTVAKDLVLVVKSWSTERKTGFTVTAPAGASASASGGGGSATSPPRQRIVEIVPNLSMTAAQDYANKRYAEIVRNERVLAWEECGDMALTTRNMVQITGTQSSFDQNYYVDSIVRNIDTAGNGYRMTVRIKNVSGNSGSF